MTREEMQELKRLAQEATPGPWRVAGTDEKPCPVVSSMDRMGYQIHSTLHVKSSDPDVWEHMHETYCRDAAFIAAANPQAVLALIARIEELEGE